MKKKSSKFKFFTMAMSNETALDILPFGMGYFLGEDGQPDPTTLGVAMMFQSLQIASNPHFTPAPYEN